MRYGISAASLILNGKRILLVNHRQEGAYDFWLPPGGGLEGYESILDCARREAYEETGLTVDLDRIVYLEEYYEPGYHFCKFFILCCSYRGDLTLVNRDQGETFLVDARFFSREELADLEVYPEVLRDRFWDDLEAGFPQMQYLGLVEAKY
jgi:8-oxo-dGTP pyrophosphatase MutT (NUDIX family)